MGPREPDQSVTALPDGTLVAELARLPRRPHSFVLSLTPAQLDGAIVDLGLLGLRKVRLAGQLTPVGKRDWSLRAQLGATVIQPCTVTLEPVTTRLDEPVARSFVEQWEDPEAGSEIEMPEDDTTDPLPAALDLMGLLHESLSLALPLYPRAGSAEFENIAVTKPGVSPMTDADAKPFAGLAALRAQLSPPQDPAESDETDGNDDANRE